MECQSNVRWNENRIKTVCIIFRNSLFPPDVVWLSCYTERCFFLSTCRISAHQGRVVHSSSLFCGLLQSLGVAEHTCFHAFILKTVQEQLCFTLERMKVILPASCVLNAALQQFHQQLQKPVCSSACVPAAAASLPAPLPSLGPPCREHWLLHECAALNTTWTEITSISAHCVELKEMAAEQSLFSKRKRKTSFILSSTNEILVVVIELCFSWLRNGGPSIGLVKGISLRFNLWRQPAGQPELTLSSCFSSPSDRPSDHCFKAAATPARPANMNLFCFSLVSGRVLCNYGCHAIQHFHGSVPSMLLGQYILHTE